MSILDRLEDKISYSRAFTTAEMLLVLVIISFLILAIPPLMHKKFEKQLTRGEHGRYECWRDQNGNVMEFLATNRRGIIKGDGDARVPSSLRGDRVQSGRCEFDPLEDAPEANYFSIQAVGGGAGGAMAPKTKALIDTRIHPKEDDYEQILRRYTDSTADEEQIVYLGKNNATEAENIRWINKVRTSLSDLTNSSADSGNGRDLSDSEIGTGTAVFSYSTSLNRFAANPSTKWVADYFPKVKGINNQGSFGYIYFCGGHGSRGEAFHRAQYSYNAGNGEYQLHITYVEGQMGGRPRCYSVRNPIIETDVESRNDVDSDNWKGFWFNIPNERMLWASDLNLYIADSEGAEDKACENYRTSNHNLSKCKNIYKANGNLTPCYNGTNCYSKRRFHFNLLNLVDAKFSDPGPLMSTCNGSSRSNYIGNCHRLHYEGNGDGIGLRDKFNYFKGCAPYGIFSSKGYWHNYCNYFNGAAEEAPVAPGEYPIEFTLKVPIHEHNGELNYVSDSTHGLKTGYNDWYRVDPTSSTPYANIESPDVSVFQSHVNTDKSYVFNFRGTAPRNDSDSNLDYGVGGNIRQAKVSGFRDDPITSQNSQQHKYPASISMQDRFKKADSYMFSERHFFSGNRNVSVEYIADYNNGTRFNDIAIIAGLIHYADEHEIMKKFLREPAGSGQWADLTPDIKFKISAENDSGAVANFDCKLKGGARGFQAPTNLSSSNVYDANSREKYNDSGNKAQDAHIAWDNNICVRDSANNRLFPENSDHRNATDINYNKPFAFMKIRGYIDNNPPKSIYATPYYGHGDGLPYPNYSKKDIIIPIKNKESTGNSNITSYGLRMNTDVGIYKAASTIFPSEIHMHRSFKYDTPTYGFAGESGQNISVMLTKLTDKLELAPGNGGQGARATNNYNSYENPENGKDTVIWMKKRSFNGTCENENDNNYNCRKILSARGGAAKDGGGIGQRMILLGESTFPDDDACTTTHEINDCYDKGVATINEAPLRFSTGSGFVVIKEFDRRTKMPSALARAFTEGTANAPGSGGDGGYSFIGKNGGFERIFSGVFSETTCSDNRLHQGNYCKHTNLTADSLNAIDDKGGWSNDSHMTENTNITTQSVKRNYAESIGQYSRFYKCRGRKDDDTGEFAEIDSTDGDCPAQNGVPGAIIIVW